MTRCTFSLWLFDFYIAYIIQYAGLHKSQAGIKIAGRNINIHRYEVDTSLMAESKEELKSFLMRRGDAKTGLKLNIQKTIYKIYSTFMASGQTTSYQVHEGKVETEADFIFLGSHTTMDLDCSPKLTDTCSLEGRKTVKNLDNVLRRRDLFCY